MNKENFIEKCKLAVVSIMFEDDPLLKIIQKLGIGLEELDGLESWKKEAIRKSVDEYVENCFLDVEI